ncbi:MAG: metallophosphoesterase [Planctomycetes bacterium]|nr:metallophosphoesterase [Planctomycetota bacterium]
MKSRLALPALFALLFVTAHLREPAVAAVDAARDALRAGTDSAVALRAPADVDAFSFVVFGDRTGGPDSGLAILGDAVEMANRLGPDFTMTVGDLVDGYNEDADWLRQMREYKAVMQGLEAPWFPVCGNHDVYARPKKPGEHMPLYKQHFGPLYYSFDYKWGHFVALFTDESLEFHEPEKNQNFGEEQLAWLAEDLAQTRAEQIFVFQHHPRWNYPGTNWPRVHELFVQDGRPVTVFAGHTHQYRDDGVVDGVHYLTLGRTGASGDTFDTSASLHHINHVHVRRDRVVMAMLPVGSIYGVDAVTGAELDEMHVLRRGDWLEAEATAELYTDRDGDAAFDVRLANPTDRTVRWSLADVGRDAVELGTHAGRLGPGESKHLTLAVQGGLPWFAGKRPDVRLEARLEYDLASGLSQTIAVAVPARVRLPEYDAPNSIPASASHVLALDGKGALRVDLPQRLDALTLEAWVRADEPRERMALMAKTQGSAFGIFLRDEGHDAPGAFVHSQALPPAGRPGYASVWADGGFPWGRWAHVALSWDGAVARLFVDGALRGEAPAPGPLTWNDLPLWIGADPDGSGRPTSFLKGELDEVRLSSVARYTAPFTPERGWLETDADTVLLLHLDVHTGELHPDASGRANHAWAQGEVDLR